MTISARLRALVTRRAGFACEFCGVTEIDAGGELTIDQQQIIQLLLSLTDDRT